MEYNFASLIVQSLRSLLFLTAELPAGTAAAMGVWGQSFLVADRRLESLSWSQALKQTFTVHRKRAETLCFSERLEPSTGVSAPRSRPCPLHEARRAALPPWGGAPGHPGPWLTCVRPRVKGRGGERGSLRCLHRCTPLCQHMAECATRETELFTALVVITSRDLESSTDFCLVTVPVSWL